MDDPQEATRELNITILKEKELVLSETTNPDNLTETDGPGNPEGLTHYLGQDRNEQAKLDITLKFLPENANLPAQIAELTGPDCPASFSDHTPAIPELQKRSIHTKGVSSSGSTTGSVFYLFFSGLVINVLLSPFPDFLLLICY